LSALLAIGCLTCGGVGLLDWADGFDREILVGHEAFHFASYRGAFALVWSRPWPDERWVRTARLVSRPTPFQVHNGIIADVIEERLTLTTDGRNSQTIHYRGIQSNMIVAPFAASLLPAWWLIVRRQDRLRHRQGVCGGCGYDLRATPTRYPECGCRTGTSLLQRGNQ
jgi:hypothetical protein